MHRRPSKPLHFRDLRGKDMDHRQPSAGVHDLDDYFGYDFVDVHSCDMLRRRLHPDQGSDDLDDLDERTDLFAHRRKPNPEVR